MVTVTSTGFPGQMLPPPLTLPLTGRHGMVTVPVATPLSTFALRLPVPGNEAVKVAVAVPDGWMVVCGAERVPRTGLVNVIGKPMRTPRFATGMNVPAELVRNV